MYTLKKRLQTVKRLRSRQTIKQAKSIPSQAMEDAKNIFNHLDRNKDGIIDKDELKCAIMKRSGLRDIALMIETLDPDLNKDGRIDFNEFLAFMEQIRKIPKEDDMRMMFYIFNDNRASVNEKLTMEEMRKGFHKLGVDPEEDDLKEFMKSADRDGDGQLDFEEFKAIMKDFL